MKAVQQFIERVSIELLYNIISNRGTMTYLKLSKTFMEKYDYELMEFFGFEKETKGSRLKFIKRVPGLKVIAEKYIVLCDYTDQSDSSEDSSYDECIYKAFNDEEMEVEGNIISVAEYREGLLLKCCEIMKNDFADVTSWEDVNGNTPLHFIAALPGLINDCDNLLKYLLQTRVDPMKANKDGKTFLHIIFGRFLAMLENGEIRFKDERINPGRWFVGSCRAVLTLVSKELSLAQITSLAKAQDKSGNTVLHEFALSTMVDSGIAQTRKNCKNLLKLDGGQSLRIPNNTGEVPLHYTQKSSIFSVFVASNKAICRTRNDRDEIPVLFILKVAVELAFAETSASTELLNQAFVKITRGRNVKSAVKLIEYLTNIVSEHEEARKTVFIPDIKGNVAIDIVLIAIRIASYDLKESSRHMPDLRSSLVQLLNEMLRKSSVSDTKRQNNNGQGFFHVLLDMGDDNEHEITKNAYILQSVEVLLEHNVVLSAADSQGHTPLDIAHKYYDKGHKLYKKCGKLLSSKGAVAKGMFDDDFSFISAMSDLSIIGKTRKLRACPNHHLCT